MSRVVTKSLRKLLEHAQEQNEQQLQLMGNEHVNAPNMDVTERGKVNEQHQNVAKPVV